MGSRGGRGRADRGDQRGYNKDGAAEGPRLFRMASAQIQGGGRGERCCSGGASVRVVRPMLQPSLRPRERLGDRAAQGEG